VERRPLEDGGRRLRDRVRPGRWAEEHRQELCVVERGPNTSSRSCTACAICCFSSGISLRVAAPRRLARRRWRACR
jgi:hypothetical protein